MTDHRDIDDMYEMFNESQGDIVSTPITPATDAEIAMWNEQQIGLVNKYKKCDAYNHDELNRTRAGCPACRPAVQPATNEQMAEWKHYAAEDSALNGNETLSLIARVEQETESSAMNAGIIQDLRICLENRAAKLTQQEETIQRLRNVLNSCESHVAKCDQNDYELLDRIRAALATGGENV